MKHGEQNNLEVNRSARRVLVTYWIDLGRVSIHTLKDSVHIRGSLMKLPGADSPLSPSSVEIIFRKIRNEIGGRRLQIDFDNWVLNSATGSWEPGVARERRNANRFSDIQERIIQSTSIRIDE
ncbi:MAG: hypothetical protein WCL44_03900 [bacterium]